MKPTNQMTPEELRLELAELLGWTELEPNDDATCDITLIGCGFRGCWKGVHGEVVPDWPGDLNACHEAEEALTDMEKLRWQQIMYEILDIYEKRKTMSEVGTNWLFYHATALQRTRALVETLRERKL